jgi:hypothetical protein
MNPRVIPAVALLAALAACAYFFLWSGQSPVAAPDFDANDSQQADKAIAALPVGAAGNSSSSTGNNPAVNRKRFAALMNSPDSSAGSIPEPTSADIARFLAKHGETAVNLVAAFEKTHDRRLLERALELFPNSPIVLMAAVESVPASPDPKPGETYQVNAQRREFIERFKDADPNNPLPWIFSAQELFKSGQTGDAVAEIRAALERPAFYTYANERMDSAQQLYEELGLHPVEAGLRAMAGLTLPHMSAANQASRSLMEWQKSATESGDTAAADEALRLTYDLGRTFATPEASRTLIGQLVGIAMEKRALEALPADAQRDWLAITPAQRLAEIETQKQNVNALVKDGGFEWLIQSQNEDLLAEYLRRNRKDGEFSALTWLKAQKK